jgi:hypothetical protein
VRQSNRSTLLPTNHGDTATVNPANTYNSPQPPNQLTSFHFLISCISKYTSYHNIRFSTGCLSDIIFNPQFALGGATAAQTIISQ